jgi:hypothetical protein
LAKGIQARLLIDGVNLTNSALKELNMRAASAHLNIFLELDLDLQQHVAGHFNFGCNCDVPHSERDHMHTLLHIPTQTTQDEDGDGTWFEWFTERGKGHHHCSNASRSSHFNLCMFFESPATAPRGVTDEFVTLWEQVPSGEGELLC